MPTCVIREVYGDLFTVNDSYSLCHCVAADLRMDKGIARIFRLRFREIETLQRQKVEPGGVALLRDGNRLIFYLVTKDYSWDHPTYQQLRSSLKAMRCRMLDFSIDKVAMPRIGCGLDGLDWAKVKSILTEVFKDDDVELVVYNYTK